MKNLRLLLTATALLTTACATAPAPTPDPAPAIDTAQYRQDLENAYDEIVAREDEPVDAPQVDVEAAASIDIPQHRTIDGALHYFTTQLRDSIQTSLIRSAKYRKIIDQALAEERLPKGLAYLPVIESAYMPTLTSRAGAHGIWQFMPETAREYGLRVDWWVDERADPIRSARAAAAYLRDLHRMFEDWPLALAAYNCGPGRVRRALDRTGATTFWELLEMMALPKETRGYVPTFFATLRIAADPATYGFQLTRAADAGGEQEVELEGPVSIKHLAAVAGVDEEMLRELNPAFRRGLLPPGRASLRLPPAAAALVAERARTLKNDDAEMMVCSYTMRGSDTVKKLAQKIGTDPETILAMNELAAGARVRAGASIYLPVRARELGALLRHSEDRAVYYAVKKGDTVYSIAKRHSLTVADLRDLNDLPKNAKLRPGQKLRVATSRGVTAGGM
jgi:membrane-bound lytic murein transglycosylase D